MKDYKNIDGHPLLLMIQNQFVSMIEMNKDDELPKEVDVIILGTGLPEDIVAAACARSGLNVLHLDRNDFYGADWASFNLKTIDEWISTNKKDLNIDETSLLSHLNDGESFISIGNKKTIRNIKKQWEPASNREIPITSEGEETKSIRNILEGEWRRFSIDLAPKVLLSRGPMVQTLCDSDVAKYAEFKCVDRLLCMEKKDERLIYHRVPCTKGDIFESKQLSMLDKRRLMKFMTLCGEWNTSPDDVEGWKEFADLPFESFLKSQGIDGNVKNFILNSIGILECNSTTKQGLSAVCRFVDSVGRFGPSPFLICLYGCGDLPQCFCRLCAVYGGTYCLNRRVDGLIQKDDKVIAVITNGQRINCQHVIMAAEYLPKKYEHDIESNEKWISRYVYITDRSIWKEENEHVSLLSLAELDPSCSPRMLEAGFQVCVAPKGYYLVHITAETPEKGNKIEEVVEKVLGEDEDRPSALWSLSFECLSSLPLSNLPLNVAILTGPDINLTYSSVIQQAQDIFSRFWPDRDFLPRSLQMEENEAEESEKKMTEEEEMRDQTPETRE